MTFYQAKPPPGKYRLLIDDYVLLADAGAFHGARTELIEGEVIVTSPQYLPHGFVKTELYDQLRDTLRDIGSPLRAMSEVSLEIVSRSMPARDIMLTMQPRGTKAAQVGTISLLVEVADSSLADDLGVKLRLYASAGIPEYWVADVNGRVIHRMWSPAGEDYDKHDEVAFGDQLAAATIDGLTIETAGL